MRAISASRIGLGNAPLQAVCLDLEGVLIPEIWIAVAERTGIDALRATTRDVADYDVLMRRRLALLAEHGLRLADVAEAVRGLAPLDGAAEFVEWLRRRGPVLLLSDTFQEFAGGLLAALRWPPLFCHRLRVDADGRIADYALRLADHKRRTVSALQGLNFEVAAIGDSHNDTAMLAQADLGILFRAPAAVRRVLPGLPTAEGYDALRSLLEGGAARPPVAAASSAD